MRATPNAAVRIERELTVQILRGAWAPGSHLPTVRDLAARHGVTPATIQRALARLESTGLVTARQGSGTRVNDPHEAGDLSLVPAWLEATADDPPRAAGILADLLEVRRVLATRLVVRHRRAIEEAIPELVGLAGGLGAGQGGVQELRAADLAFARALLRRTGNNAAMAVLAAADRVVAAVPGVAEAMYAEPERNAEGMLRVLRAVASGLDTAALGQVVEEALAEADERTVGRYRSWLEAR